MPSSIPFDHPSLVLGNIVNPLILNKLKQINVLQNKIDSGQDKMNSFIAMKRSLEMTINELLNMNVNTSSLEEKIKEIDDSILKAASDYATIRLTNESSIQGLREEIGDIEPDDDVESPLDYLQTEVKKMPLSANSLKMDAQYFSYDKNDEENPLATMASIENYIKESTSSLGQKASANMSSTASSQIGLQRKNHDITGTLIITSTCTHRNASILAPCVIDVDKAIMVWNAINKADGFGVINESTMSLQANSVQNKDSKHISILSGATYGSSFVGMVHILRQEATGNGGSGKKGSNNPSLTELASGLQERLTVGSWLEESAGGFGIDPSISDDIKSLLSTQKIASHITIAVMGALPSIKSNELKMGVKTFSDYNPAKLTGSLAAISGATSAEQSTVGQAANASKTGARMLAMEASTIQNVMMGLGKIDQSSNKTMDINSLMTAFEDYLQEVKKEEAGVPINFYIKNIPKNQIAKLWMDKYGTPGKTPSSTKAKTT